MSKGIHQKSTSRNYADSKKTESLKQWVLENFSTTRKQSETFCASLVVEDYSLQAAAFASPPKWHLAHTTWFFETFLLKPYLDNYKTPNEKYEVLFNSYYNGIGEQFPRPQRGLLSRPTVDEVLEYRHKVNHSMLALLDDEGHRDYDTILQRCVLGIEHEKQHQELFFTDIKYSLSVNPLFPVFSDAPQDAHTISSGPLPLAWLDYEGGLIDIGFQGDSFCFDNELPRHKTYINNFAIANRLINNEEYQAFIDDGGYQRSELWLADGWTLVQQEAWKGPLYWYELEGEAMEYTLHGLQARSPHQPVCHVSGYEADAFARWYGARLPTEMEWELAASNLPVSTQGVDSGYFHPQVLNVKEREGSNLGSEVVELESHANEPNLLQLYGDCWQWTQSAYSPYPGFKPESGAVGEYNGKFMSNQWVLRGGSCVSKADHLRPSYRNFFYPQDRWQFSGIRLAK